MLFIALLCRRGSTPGWPPPADRPRQPGAGELENLLDEIEETLLVAGFAAGLVAGFSAGLSPL